MIHFFKRKAPHFILIILMILFSVPVSAQSVKRVQKHFDKALLYFKADNYTMAVKEAENVLQHDSTFVNAHLLLADIYQ